MRHIISISLNHGKSTIGRNFRYLAFKYKINCGYWHNNFSYINNCISDYIENGNSQDMYNIGIIIRDLCLSKADGQFLFDNIQRKEFIELLCIT